MIGARKAAGLTQHALAVRLKKPQSFVAKYEVANAGSMLWNSSQSPHALGSDPLKLIATL